MIYKTYCFKKKLLNYHELLADSNVFEKFYEIENPTNAELTAMPDGRVDIQFTWKDGKMVANICGSLLNGKVSFLTNFDKCFGARFHVGALPKEIKKNLDIIINNRIMLDNVLPLAQWKDIFHENLPLEQKADYVLQLFENKKTTQDNEIIQYLLKEIHKNQGHVIISDMIENLGYSHRYTNYVFKTNVGCSIKKFACIVRMQESLSCVLDCKEDEIYNKLGYYDQAHFIHDFKKFTLLTPNAMKKKEREMNFV